MHLAFHRSDPVILGRSMHKWNLYFALQSPPFSPSSISYFCMIVLTSPNFSFCPLLFQAIIESPNNQLTLSDIYAWFQSTFGHFRQHNATWKVTWNTKPNNSNSLMKTRNFPLAVFGVWFVTGWLDITYTEDNCWNSRVRVRSGLLTIIRHWGTPQGFGITLAKPSDALSSLIISRSRHAAKTVLVSYPNVRMSVLDSTMLMLNYARDEDCNFLRPPSHNRGPT